MSVHTLPHLTLGKSRPLWPVMMDDSAPTHGRRKLIETNKNVLPQKRTVVAELCGETYSKSYEKNGVEKRPQR